MTIEGLSVRIRLISPVLGVLLTAAGLGAMVAMPSHADAPKPLYLHSKASGYTADWDADLQSSTGSSATAKKAPSGSTMDTSPPTKTASSAAGWNPAGGTAAGSRLVPAFGIPDLGGAAVTSACLDLWISVGIPSSAGTAASIPVDVVATLTDGTSGTPVSATNTLSKPNAGGIMHIVGIVNFPSTKLAAKDSSIEFSSTPSSAAGGWTLNYDSKLNPSNITFNPETCAGAAPIPPGTGSASASASASPTGSATPTGTATPNPTGSATPTATDTPTPSVVPTNDAGRQETNLEYTGDTSGRYDTDVPVAAKVTMGDGTPVPAGTITFTLGDQTVAADLAPDGTAATTLHIRPTAGTYVMQVEFQPNDAFATSAQQVPFSVTRMPTRCVVTHQLTSRGMVLTGTFKDAAGKVLAGQSIVFTFGGKTYKTVTSGSTGKATATLPGGHGTYAATLRTTSRYASCSATYKA
jgi:hypothetical protein